MSLWPEWPFPVARRGQNFIALLYIFSLLDSFCDLFKKFLVSFLHRTTSLRIYFVQQTSFFFFLNRNLVSNFSRSSFRSWALIKIDPDLRFSDDLRLMSPTILWHLNIWSPVGSYLREAQEIWHARSSMSLGTGFEFSKGSCHFQPSLLTIFFFFLVPDVSSLHLPLQLPSTCYLWCAIMDSNHLHP